MILLGNNYLAWLQSATAGTFNAIRGQGTLSDSRSQTEIDTSDKTTSGYATSAYGLIKVDIELDIKVNLPDANGYTRLETLANSQTPEVFQVRKNGTAGALADAIFSASCYFTIKSRKFNKDGTVDATIGIGLASAPTIDQLA